MFLRIQGSGREKNGWWYVIFMRNQQVLIIPEREERSCRIMDRILKPGWSR